MQSSCFFVSRGFAPAYGSAAHIRLEVEEQDRVEPKNRSEFPGAVGAHCGCVFD